MDRTEAAIEQKKKQQEVLQRIKSNEARTIKAICECFSTDAGKIALYYIMSECGFQDHSVIVEPIQGGITNNTVIYNEARRSFYLDLRQRLMSRPDILIDVEINKLQGEKSNG